MKDIVITARMVRRELLILAGCFGLAILFDLVAIVQYGRPLVELLTTIGYELVIALVLYLLTLILRGLWWCIKALFTRKPKHH